MKRIILHIGMPKTGTSSLQNFFCNNRDALSSAGIGFYVPKDCTIVRDHEANGSFLSKYIYNSGTDPYFTESSRNNPIHYLETKDDPANDIRSFSEFSGDFHEILLSEEKFWWNSFFFKDWWMRIRNCLHDLCGESVIRPVIYLRRQDTWALSWWKELLPALSDRRIQSFHDFLSWMEKMNMLDYDTCIKNLEDVFGAENVIVRVYEKASTEKDTIFHDFLSAADITRHDDFYTKHHPVNESFSLLTAYARLLIVQGGVKNRTDHITGKISTRMACQLFSREHPETHQCYPLTPDERKSVLERYMEGNRKVAERYDLGEDLFSYDIEPYEVLKEDPQRDLQNAKEILRLKNLSPSAYHWICYMMDKS